MSRRSVLQCVVRAIGAGAVCLIAYTSVSAQTHELLYEFRSPLSGPQGRLLQTADGTLFGTAINGGLGYGGLFKITPAGNFVELHRFSGSDGAYPQGGVIQGSDGALYGTTYGGGSNQQDYGTIFKWTAGPGGGLTTLHAFSGSDGAYPYLPLVQRSDGAIYGVSDAGPQGYGTAFRWNTSGFSTIHTFTLFNGAWPSGGLTEGPDGALYGTTWAGGNGAGGTLFRITFGPTVSQTITFDALGNKQYGDAPFNITATATSGLPVSFSATGSCTVAGSTVTLTGANACAITASQPGNGTYLPAQSVTRTFFVVHSWSNVLQPINTDGTSIFKLGSTAAVKFRLTGGSSGLTTLPARIYTTKISSGVSGFEIEATATNAPDAGNQFRYDAASDQYIFNWGTKGLTEGTWQIRIDLQDGAPARTVLVSLKK